MPPASKATVAHPFLFAIQTEYWRTWDIALTDFAGVDLATVNEADDWRRNRHRFGPGG